MAIKAIKKIKETTSLFLKKRKLFSKKIRPALETIAQKANELVNNPFSETYRANGLSIYRAKEKVLDIDITKDSIDVYFKDITILDPATREINEQTIGIPVCYMPTPKTES